MYEIEQGSYKSFLAPVLELKALTFNIIRN